MSRFLAVGEALIDFLPGEEEGVYLRRAGGAPANVAVAMARQGIESGFLGVVGDDDFGRFLVKTLEDAGVTFCRKEFTRAATTTMAFVSLSPEGERSFTFARKPGADMFLTKEMVDDADVSGDTIVHAGSCSLSKGSAAEATAYAIRKAHDAGVLVSFDVNYRDLMWDGDRKAAGEAVKSLLHCIDILKISEEERDLIGDGGIPEIMETYGLPVVVETLGGEGSRVYYQGSTECVPPVKAKVVDTCGAGDAFFGGFLSELLRAGVRKPEELSVEILRRALQSGNVAGSLAVRKKGAMESLPTVAETEKLRREFYGEA